MKKGIVWFRNNLRLHDNEALSQAIAQCDEIIPVFVFDTRQFRKDVWGHSKTGPFRGRFLFETVKALKNALQEKGSDLIIQTGKTEEVLQKLVTQYEAQHIFAPKAYTSEEIEIEEAVHRFSEIHFYHTTTMVHPADLPFYVAYLPDIFTQFRKAVEKQAPIRKEIPEPDQISSPEIVPTSLPKEQFFLAKPLPKDHRAAIDFKGGEAEGLKRLQHYVWETESIATYKKTRNGLIGADYSSKFSAWLANGALSARRIYWEIKKFEKEITKNQSTYWLIFELLWRDYFQFIAMKHGNRIFHSSGLKTQKKITSQNEEIFEKWKNGKTGDDFVDANMIEIQQTGFMSNRGRQNVASFLVHDLGIDWRMGASYFESQLIDYDPCSNYGNWLYVSGIGNDPRPGRKFNTKLQANKYDQDGTYREMWLEKPVGA
ncbi:MAG: DASH family cryptochrome [Saprospiraceae bacterium]|nr:DASH family cryptochrome [Saprospiraceae bacterium]